MSDSVDTEEFVNEVKGSFDLSARLQNRPMRHDSVVVYTDEVTAERIQTIEGALQQLTDMPTAIGQLAKAVENMNPEAAKVLADIAESGIRDIGEYTSLENDKAELVEKLKESALKFELQAIPQIILKDCRRQAKRKLGIKGNIPEDRAEEFSDTMTAIALTKAVTRVHSVDGVNDGISYEDAANLPSYLPLSEWLKIDVKLADLGSKDVISGAITDDPDF